MHSNYQVVEVEFAADASSLMSAEAACDTVRRWVVQACAAAEAQVESIEITFTHRSFWRPRFTRPAFYSDAHVIVVADADVCEILSSGVVPRPGVVANAIL